VGGVVSWLRGFLQYHICFSWIGGSSKCGRPSGFGLELVAGVVSKHSLH